MSGGSYDYLCYADDTEALSQRRVALAAMSERLGGLPWARVASVETERIAAAFRRLDAYIESSSALREVWHAVEWWDSCDYSEQQARDAAAEYQALQELPHTAAKP